jgi:hypothetical protein
VLLSAGIASVLHYVNPLFCSSTILCFAGYVIVGNEDDRSRRELQMRFTPLCLFAITDESRRDFA